MSFALSRGDILSNVTKVYFDCSNWLWFCRIKVGVMLLSISGDVREAMMIIACRSSFSAFFSSSGVFTSMPWVLRMDLSNFARFRMIFFGGFWTLVSAEAFERGLRLCPYVVSFCSNSYGVT